MLEEDIYSEIRVNNEKKYGSNIALYGPTLLEQPYNDKTHFIYELLQNSEDANSSQVVFKLYEDRLEVYNNGTIFSLDNLKAICDIADGTKKGNSHQIGKFGIGFKSVYAYTRKPQVHSGERSFFIENYVHPHKIEKREDLPSNETLFVIPFNHYYVKASQSFKDIEHRLLNLEYTTLLFLNKVSEIKVFIEDNLTVFYKKEVEKDNHNLKYISLIKDTKQDNLKTTNIKHWLVLNKNVVFDKVKLKLEIAYNLIKDKNDKYIIFPVENSRISVSFPTEKNTFLNFIIQAPFDTNNSRSDINKNSTKNKFLLDEMFNFVGETINVIKEENLLDINFLNVLPIDSNLNKEEYEIYKKMYEAVYKKLSSDEEFIPTQDGFTNKNKALIASSKKIKNLLSSEQLYYLLNKENLNWITDEITPTNTKTAKIYFYLKRHELFVEEINNEKLFFLLNRAFLEKQTDYWLIEFYTFLNTTLDFNPNSKEKISILGKPIIRLENNSHIIPFTNEGKPNCYLQGEKSLISNKYNFVKKVFLTNENSFSFFKYKLGFTEPDLLSEITTHIFPKYETQTNVVTEEYFEDFQKIVTYYEQKQNIYSIKEIKELYILLAFNNETEELKLVKPSDCYLKTRDLEKYFKNYTNINFLAQEKYLQEINLNDNKFFTDIGVNSAPKIMRTRNNTILSQGQKESFTSGKVFTREDYIETKNLEGLKEFLDNLESIEDSILLWKTILGVYKSDIRCFEGIYSWFGRNSSPNESSFPSEILKQLKEYPWLFKKNSNRVYKPEEIKYSELDNMYELEVSKDSYITLYVDSLVDVLNFKVKLDTTGLSDELKKVVEFSETFEPFLEQMSYEEISNILKNHLDNKSKWKPEYNFDQVPVNILSFKESKSTPSNRAINSDSNSSSDKLKNETNKISSKDKKDIGYWGEGYIFRYLKETLKNKYLDTTFEETKDGFKLLKSNSIVAEIIWLNKNSDSGIGYDIEVIENGIHKYIEVKSTKTNSKEDFDLSKSQWEFAKEKKDNYIIYRVFSAGTLQASLIEIVNPYKLWKENKLEIKSIKIVI